MKLFRRIPDDVDPERIPPGQYVTSRFPVLHVGNVPDVDLERWDFTVGGLVVDERRWTYDEFVAMEPVRIRADIHCVTKWSKLDTTWTGIATRTVWDHLEPLDGATHVLVHAEHGFTANLPIDDFLAEGSVFAYRFDGEPLAPEHGWPLRLVVPHLYFWKSVKWVRGFTLLADDRPGFWERNGYHMYGDPWREQRFWGD